MLYAGKLPDMDIQTNSITNTSPQAIDPVSDSELVTRVREGVVDAFEIIMRRYNQRLYRIARSILREDQEALDVVQETYVKAYYQLHQFKGPEGFVSWLSRIASNEAMMRLRKSKRMDYTLDDPDHGHLDMESSDLQPMDDLANQQLRKLLEDAIDKLPVNYRSVYVMRAIQQLSTRETAGSLGITEEVVKTRFLRAKRSLQKVFEVHLKKAGLEVFEFAGQRCDSIVLAVIRRLSLK